MHPDGFPLPRILSPLPERANFDLADQALLDMERVPGPPLSPWQRFVIRHGLVTVDGRLWFDVVVLRMARQQGKTFVMRRVMWHRLFRGPELFQQPQRIINTHFDSLQAVRLMKPLALSLGYGRTGGTPGLSSQTFMAQWYPGGEEGEDFSVWWARAMTMAGLTGNSGLTFAFVDELQDAREKQVQEALGGSLSGARINQPQRWFAGTGVKYSPDGTAKSDLLLKLKAIMATTPRMLWIEWSAPPGTDPTDEEGWRWASPDWSDSRADYLRTELAMALAPRPDGTNTLDEFVANYLITDDFIRVKESPDVEAVERSEWATLELVGHDVEWQVAAVNTWYGEPPVVALAAMLPHGQVLVSCVQCWSMAHAGTVTAGIPAVLAARAIAEGPEFAAMMVEPRTGTTSAALAELRRLINEGAILHDGGETLTTQVLGARIARATATSGLPRVTSPERLDAVQAAMWAAAAARAGAGSGFWSA
jgi:hypothetical protein